MASSSSSSGDPSSKSVSTFSVEEPAVDRTSLLRSQSSRRQTQSYSHGLRQSTVSSATTYGSVYGSMPARRARSRTTAHSAHRPHGNSNHRLRAFSIEVQDPRLRRMSRSESERSISRGMRPKTGSTRSIRSIQDSSGAPIGGLAHDSEFAGAGLKKVREDGAELGDGEEGSDEDEGSEEGEPVLSRFSIFALTINFIIGVGVLDLPYIFYQSGILLCVVLVILSTFGSHLAVNFLLESQSRGIMRTKAEGSAENAVNFWFKLELSELCEIFVGNWFKYIYLFIFYIFQTSTLWSYAAVFSQTGASIVSPALVTSETGLNRSAANITCTGTFDPQCYTLYYIFLSVFAVCEVIMTVVGLKEQAVVQTILAVYRFAAVFAMSILAFIGLGIGSSLNGESASPEVVLWKWNGVASALPSIVFSQLLQMAIPGLMDPMPAREKSQYHFFGAFSTCAGCYVLLSTVLSIYLGCNIRSPVTLNFNEFLGFMDVSAYDSSGIGTKLVVQFFKYFIIIFPCLDLFSAFSLNAIVLANNLLDIFPDAFIDKVGFTRLKVACSVFVAVVPVILAFIAHNLVTIINIAGTTGMLLMFFFPGMLQFFSMKYYAHKSSDTPFTPKHGSCLRIFFTRGAAIAVMALGWALFAFSCVALFLPADEVSCNATSS